jgi:hypothetical protein
MRASPLFAVIVAAALPLSATASLADRTAADSCAAKLPADAKLVYSAAISGVAPGIDLRDMVRSKTRGLVMGGKLDRGKARAAAEAAGACLKQVL